MRLLRGIIIGVICAATALFVAYLLLPERFISIAGRVNYSSVERILYVKNPLNNGRQCAAKTAYVSQDSAQYFENEGFPFEINDDCANLQRLLVQYVRDRDHSEVRHLISQGANVESPDWSMNEPYYPLQSTDIEDVEMLKLLLDNGADVNREFCCCASCNSSLSRAINAGQAETVRLLLQYGADSYYRPSFGDEELLFPCELATRRNDAAIMDAMANACDESFLSRIAIRLRRLTNKGRR